MSKMTILPRLERAEDPDFSRWDAVDVPIVNHPKFQAVLDKMGVRAQAFGAIGLDKTYLQELDPQIAAEPDQVTGYGLVVARITAQKTKEVILAENLPTIEALETLVDETIAQITQTGDEELRIYFLEPRKSRPAPGPSPLPVEAVKPVPKPPATTYVVAEVKKAA